MLQSRILIDNYMNRFNKPDFIVQYTLSRSTSFFLHVARWLNPVATNTAFPHPVHSETHV